MCMCRRVLSSATITLHAYSEQVDSGQTKLGRKKEVSGSLYKIKVKNPLPNPCKIYTTLQAYICVYEKNVRCIEHWVFFNLRLQVVNENCINWKRKKLTGHELLKLSRSLC